MNERIRLLAREAGFMPDNFISRWEAEFDLFAQLIRSECCDFLKDTLDDQFAAEQLLEYFEFDN
jgi:hypothetical protein